MTQALTLRPARPDERRVLEEMQRRASLPWEDYRAVLIENPDAIDLPQDQIDTGHVIVCEQQGTLAGFAVVLPRTDGNAELDGLFVDPGMWRGGIGRALIHEAFGLAQKRGASAIDVIANPQALDFYRACGFEVVDQRKTRFGPAIGMRLRINR